MMNRNPERIRTGFPAVDEVLYTDAGTAGLTALVARPGVGKTTFLLDIALRIAGQSKNVCLYTDESVAKIQAIADRKGISANEHAHLHVFNGFPAKVSKDTAIIMIDKQEPPNGHADYLVYLRKVCSEYHIPVVLAFLLPNAKENLSLPAIREKADAVLLLSRSPYHSDNETETMPLTALTYTKTTACGKTTGTDTLYFDSEKYAFVTAEEKAVDKCF